MVDKIFQANTINNKYFISVFLTALGSIIAWVHIVKQFFLYYEVEETLAVYSNTVIPHPFLTACFYGGFGFLIAFFFAWKFYKKRPSSKHGLYYTIFLLGGTIFAWNFAGRDLFKFLLADTSTGEIVGCSGTVISNPFLTACFAGALLFLLLFLINLILKK